MFYLKNVKSNSYHICSSNHNDKYFDKFSNTTYEVHIPSIDNESEGCAIKYGEEYLNSHQNGYTKQTPKEHVQKLN